METDMLNMLALVQERRDSTRRRRQEHQRPARRRHRHRLAMIGAGIGLGRIGGQAAEAIARQPEAAGEIRGAGLLFAVLLEGATIIALVFALLFKLIA